MNKSSKPKLKNGHYVLSKEQAYKQHYLEVVLEGNISRLKEKFWQMKIHAREAEECVKKHELECEDLSYDEIIKKTEELNKYLDSLFKDLLKTLSIDN